MRCVSLRLRVMKLLNELYKTYETIVYTSLDQDFATTLIKEELDKNGLIISTVLTKDYCFKRTLCYKKNGYYIKDLRIFKNRDLSRTHTNLD